MSTHDTLHRALTSVKEAMGEAGSLLAEVVLGKPSRALADCFTDPISSCGACGADKRKYRTCCHAPGGGWSCNNFCDYC